MIYLVRLCGKKGCVVMSSSKQRKTQRKGMIGRTLHNGEYHIESLLGRGGMGQVFLATFVPLDTPVALKQLKADKPLPAKCFQVRDAER